MKNWQTIKDSAFEEMAYMFIGKRAAKIRLLY